MTILSFNLSSVTVFWALILNGFFTAIGAAAGNIIAQSLKDRLTKKQRDAMKNEIKAEIKQESKR